jgi:ribosomal protein L25 (general stress protein Ctc)
MYVSSSSYAISSSSQGVLVAILCQLQDSGELAQLSISEQHIAALLKVLDTHAVSDTVQEVSMV